MFLPAFSLKAFSERKANLKEQLVPRLEPPKSLFQIFVSFLFCFCSIQENHFSNKLNLKFKELFDINFNLLTDKYIAAATVVVSV